LAPVTRNIGLSLGADICWPLCFEGIMKQMDPKIRWKGDTVSFNVERVSIEPFNLRQGVKYDLVVDRLTHWYHTSREWLKKGILMDGLYVFNNPWSIQANEKHTSYAAMMALGMPIPETWMVPPKSYSSELVDVRATLRSYAKLFDLGQVGAQVGYPHFMKPYDGGGWRAVSRITDEKSLKANYDKSGTQVMHLQAAVQPFDRFVRMVGFGPQTRAVLYNPDAPLHDRYTMEKEKDFLSDKERKLLEDTLLTINAFFGWEFNSCESLRGSDGTWYPIDFANPCPDSQVTSLHYHFPWMVKSYLRWSLYCATTQRKMRKTLDWEPWYEIAAKDWSYEEKLTEYGKIARKRLDADKFEDFCQKHLPQLDEVAWEFFGSEQAKEAVRKKVTALFPAHEVEQFTELFWKRIQHWRAEQKA
jgi:hypothetical protein